jgi:hypothetical protein
MIKRKKENKYESIGRIDLENIHWICFCFHLINVRGSPFSQKKGLFGHPGVPS